MNIEPVTITDASGKQTKGFFVDAQESVSEHRRHEIWELVAIAVGIVTGMLSAAHILKKEAK